MIKFLKTIEPKYKLSLILLLILMFFAAILEMVGLSILPIIISQVVSGEINNNYYLQIYPIILKFKKILKFF